MSAFALFAMNSVGFGLGPILVGQVVVLWGLGAWTYVRDLEAKSAGPGPRRALHRAAPS